MGGSSSRYSEYRTVDEAHEAVDIILREKPFLSNSAKCLLRDLRTEIYDGLDGESNSRITIYADEKAFKFKIGRGSQHLIVNINEDTMKFSFSTGRLWTRFCRGACSLFMTIVGSAGAIGGVAMKAIKYV